MIETLKIIASLLPVFVFLLILIFMDSYKLSRPRSVLKMIGLGSLAAIIVFIINTVSFEYLKIDISLFTRYISPVIEEFSKALLIYYLLKSRQIGFLVDGAVFGFAVGAGFAFIENLYYLQALDSPNLLLWIIRGFGTAIMHGGTTAIFTIIVKTWVDRKGSEKLYYYFIGLMTAIVIHSFFNHFILPAVIITLMQLILLPTLFLLIYNKSEKVLQEWLEIGLDVDVWMLEQISNGKFSNTKQGLYLNTIKNKFSAFVIVDILCYLRLHLELAICAKGVLMMKEAGISPMVDPGISEKFSELEILEKNIGKTGKLALSPILNSSVQELWQVEFIKKYIKPEI